MAQESSSALITRLDGISRIPLPRSIRPPSAPSNIGKLGSHIGRPTLANSQRPLSFGSTRPPSAQDINALKKSNSGDRLNNIMSQAINKKATTVLKKFNQAKTCKPLQLNDKKRIKTAQSPTRSETIAENDENSFKPQLYTRSSTFVRGEDTHELVQSTPAARLMANPTHFFETPGFSDVTTTVLPNLSETVTINNMKHNCNSTHVVNSTMYFGSADQEKYKNLKSVVGERDSMLFGKTLTLTPKNLSRDLNNVETIERIKRANETHVVAKEMSQLANATYCNPPKSNDNVMKSADVPNATYCSNHMNLEDVSMPSDLEEMDTTLQATDTNEAGDDLMHELPAITPNKKQMKLPLNSTMNTERLLDITQNIMSPTRHELMCSPRSGIPMKNTSKLLYMSHFSNTTTPDRSQKSAKLGTATRPVSAYRHTPLSVNMLSPVMLKAAQSDLVLPTRTPDDDRQTEPMNVDSALCALATRTEEFYKSQVQHKKCGAQAMSLQDINNPNDKQKARFSFGLDLTESTLDCSIELIDISLSSTGVSQPNCNMNGVNGVSRNCNNNMPKSPSLQQLQHQQQQQHQNQIHQFLLKKQNSFELDESLGILTPDQMKEFLDSNATNNTNNLDLPLDVTNSNINLNNNKTFHQMRMEQTPSPEELPLDPVEVKTDISDFLSQQQQTQSVLQQRHLMALQQPQQDSLSQQTETDLSKTDQMIKSNVSKISTSFITSVTSVTSLDTGYQGDGEMSRPASRGASDHSPSNGPIARKVGPVSRQPSFNQVHAMPPTIRRQDLMTDSDFFTESDADELHHRGGDRRAQVIDGQLYGPTGTSLFISEDPQMEDSCMESSGIFTDVENRCEEDLAVMRRSQQATQELSPDVEAEDSTETVKSYRAKQLRALDQGQSAERKANSQISPLMLSSYSSERLSGDATLSNRTSYCSMDGAGSAVHLNADCSLEETAFLKTKHNTKSSTTTGTKSLCGDHMHARTPVSVDISLSPRKHVSLTSLTNDNTLTTYVEKKSAEKSASGTALYPHAKASCLDSQTVSVNGSGASSKVSLLSVACEETALATNRTPKTGNKSAKNPKVSTANVGSARKTQVPNKWDAVMNKIATNKATQVRKNYNDVKSKVSTRNVLALNSSGVSVDGSSPASSVASPRLRRSPTLAPKLTEPTTVSSKRPVLQSTIKRGTAFSSKDNIQKTDLSPGSGQPKLLAKTLIRAAKKRDVRNLSISPTDLGPPPKTQQTTNGTATRSAPHAQKRVSVSPLTNTQIGGFSTTSTAGVTAPTKNGSAENTNSSAVFKNQSHILRQQTFKDQSRLLGSAQSINTASNIIKNVSKATAVSQSHETTTINNNNSNNNFNNNHHHSAQSATGLTDKSRISSQRSSPLLGQQQAKKLGATTLTTAAAASEKKLQMKLPNARKCNLQKQNGGHAVTESKSYASTTPTTPTTNANGDGEGVGANGYLDAHELQQLKYLNRHSLNGFRDYELLRLRLQDVELSKQHQEKGVLALGILVQYMVTELDAFSCPATKLENEKFKVKMQKVLSQLQDVQNECLELQHQMCDKENYYITREEELQALHRCELEKSKDSAKEYEEGMKKHISELEAQLVAKDDEQKCKMNDYQFEMQLKLSEREQQLLAAEERLKRLTSDKDCLAERLEHAEMQHRQEMTAALARELAQNKRIEELKSELETLRETKQHKERELRDKLNLSQDEIALLRCSPTHSGDGAAPAMRHSSASCGSTPKSSVPHSELNRLQSEAESLRCVLEIKQKEVSKLNKQNEKLLRDFEECSVLHSKINSLETTKEMLQSELNIKIAKEKENVRQINELQRNLKHETQKLTRLSYDNEALTWQLKQRSEVLHHLEIKLQETFKDTSFNLDVFSLAGSSLSQNTTGASETSPPASPLTKGVIEKKDSVAWVLEMDDETPEEAATKLVRRVGSFRTSERSPMQKASCSASAAHNSSSLSASKTAGGPNRLSQSLSAASVIRKHSFEPTSNQKTRARSLSVSNSSESGGVAAASTVKANKHVKKLSRQSSVGPSQQLDVTIAMEQPISASSPYASMRPRSSTLISAKNSQNPKLITCDTSTLNTGERLKIRAFPKAAVQGLKSRKKCLEIQESAGEAMVSGANSEDEGCSASSDEIASSVSMGSATSSSSTSLNQLKNSNMSLEEVLLMENITNLSSTPMECSWSDDAEIYADNHKV